MQDRYAGDLGDFGKFGLLRALCQPREGMPISLAVVWYLNPGEDTGNDGRHTAYLEPTARNQERFRSCDPGLYDALAELVRSGNRSVAALRSRGILPPGTTFFEEPVRAPRETWFQRALESAQGQDMVFLDPDNGIRRSAPGLHPKHAFIEEIARAAAGGQGVAVYQHIHRRGRAEDQVRERAEQVEEATGIRPVSMLYHRGSARAFIVLPPPRLRERALERMREMMDGPWARHMETAPPQPRGAPSALHQAGPGMGLREWEI